MNIRELESQGLQEFERVLIKAKDDKVFDLMFVKKLEHFKMLGFVSKRHEDIIGHKGLSGLVDIEPVQLVWLGQHICGNHQAIILLFCSIEKSNVRIEPFVDNTVRLLVVHELNPVVFVPLFRMEVKLRVYFFLDHFLNFMINIVRDLLVLILELQVH